MKFFSTSWKFGVGITLSCITLWSTPSAETLEFRWLRPPSPRGYEAWAPRSADSFTPSSPFLYDIPFGAAFASVESPGWKVPAADPLPLDLQADPNPRADAPELAPPGLTSSVAFLPTDSPEAAAPAGYWNDPASAATASSAGPSTEASQASTQMPRQEWPLPSHLKNRLAPILLFLLCAAVIFAVLRMASQGKGLSALLRRQKGSQLQILETRMLGNKQFLVVVQYHRQKILLAVSNQGVQNLGFLEGSPNENLIPEQPLPLGKNLIK